MMKQFDEKLGYVLKKTRKAKKIYQPQIAKEMHVSKMAVSNWENGKRAMTAETLKEYCEILGVTVQEIFDKMEEENAGV